jgi:F-type H+-transporting ATPase subunit delta
MQLSERQLVTTLIDSLDGAETKDVDPVIKQFVKFVSTEYPFMKWSLLESEISRAWKSKYGASEIHIVSAHTLTDKAKEHLLSLAPGAELMNHVDERLIGGAIIRIDDKRIDGSVAGSLQRLRRELVK